MSAGGVEDVEEVVAEGDGAGDEGVDVAFLEFVGVFVVGAEHDAVGVGGWREGVEGIEVFRGGALADEDVEVGGGGEFFDGFFEGEAFVVGGDAAVEVGGDALAAEGGGVAVDGFPPPPGRCFGMCDFGEEVGVAGDDTPG